MTKQPPAFHCVRRSHIALRAPATLNTTFRTEWQQDMIWFAKIASKRARHAQLG